MNRLSLLLSVLFGLAIITPCSASDLEPRAELLKSGSVIPNVFAVSPCGRFIATAGGRTSGWIALWDPRSGKEITAYRGHDAGVRLLAFSPDGKTLASSEGSVVILRDVATGEKVHTFDRLPSRWYSSLAFAPDGKCLAAGVIVYEKDGTKEVSGEVVVWQLPAGNVRATLKGHAGGVTAVAFTPDGASLVSHGGRGYDASVKLWELPAMSEQRK